jgi:hypothetical protein
MPSPQKGWQSAGQFAEVSPALQVPSPQVTLQSFGQFAIVSPALAVQKPSPQKGWQSAGQLPKFSPTLHTSSPQPGQSTGQLLVFSAGESQWPSPQNGAGQLPQSLGQV